jgi:hypothetical protein
MSSGTRDSSCAVVKKMKCCLAEHSPISGAEVNSVWGFTSIVPCILIVLCLSTRKTLIYIHITNPLLVDVNKYFNREKSTTF